MKPSSNDEVRKMYEETADSYDRVNPDEEALGQVIEEGVALARHDVFAVLEEVSKSHPEEEHWYLPAIGVDPTCQGKGYGTSLLKQGLEACDRDHVAAYLESTNPLNIPLYQRCGFKVIGEIRVGSSPVLTPMLRAAREIFTISENFA